MPTIFCFAFVRAHHEEAIVAHLGNEIALVGSDVDRYVFPQHATGADPKLAGKAGIILDLRRLADGGEGKYFSTLPDFGIALHDDVLMQPDPAGKNNPRPDNAKWTDDDVGGDGALDLGGRMDRTHEFTSPTVAGTRSASRLSKALAYFPSWARPGLAHVF